MWTRRSRRKSSKVCTEEKAKASAKDVPHFLPQMFSFRPLSRSPTAGSLALKTPTEEWWCGPCRRTSRSPSHFLRYRSNHTRVFLIFLLCPFLWERISVLAGQHAWRGYLSLPDRRPVSCYCCKSPTTAWCQEPVFLAGALCTMLVDAVYPQTRRRVTSLWLNSQETLLVVSLTVVLRCIRLQHVLSPLLLSVTSSFEF